MDKIDKLMKKSKPNQKVLAYSLKLGRKHNQKHHKFHLFRHHKLHLKSKSNKKPKQNSIAEISKMVEHKQFNKFNHQQLHTILNCLAKYRKKIGRKFKPKPCAMTYLSIFHQYIETAHGSEKFLLHKDLHSKIKSVLKKAKTK